MSGCLPDTLFYAPDIRIAHALPADESCHAVRVLRLQAGDAALVTDGRGGLFRVTITHPHPQKCLFDIVEELPETARRGFRLHVAIAPTKNMERMEWFVEKATEMGVDEITPFVSRYSERRNIKPERLEKIIVSAAKQSLRRHFPTLHPLCSFDRLLQGHAASPRFIAHCHHGSKPLLQQVCRRGEDATILIGPEGDFSPEEVQKAIEAGYQPVSLGSNRLRTETAGIVAVAAVQLANS